MKKEKQVSDFGKGFVYNLILFAKHWMMLANELSDPEFRMGYDLWFNGASDHFYELEIPLKWQGTKLGNLARKIQDRALHLGHGSIGRATKKDFEDIFIDLQKLGLLIDKELGLEPVEAQWD